MMAAPLGNSFWRQCKLPTGAPRIYDTPEELWDDCCKYFEWVEENPLYECKAFSFQGEVITADLPKMRAMTIDAMCSKLGFHRDSWNEWKRSREELSDVIRLVEDIIYEQKFTGAAADLLNANIISRDLGLADKKDLNHSGEITSITRRIVRHES